VNEKQLMLYYGIGKYISLNSRKGFWGKGAIDAISERLDKELPGLRGFTSRNLRYMRTFYEEWEMLDLVGQPENTSENVPNSLELTNSELENTAIVPIWNLQVPDYPDFPMDAFLHIGFTHHRVILGKAKGIEERLFYIRRCANEHLTVEALKSSIVADDYHHQGSLPNNFMQTLPAVDQAFRAINTFKDEYLLDYINVEELGIRDRQDVDERVVENAIIHNVKNFILTFGKDFAFVRNQYHLDAFGEDQYIDLLFFNRELNCLVAVELKTGKFKTSYLGQLQGYLSVLDGFERKPHENPSIGLILCKDMNKSFVDYVIQDYAKPMGVATYKTSKDMSDELRKALPDVEALRKLLDSQEE
jgi:predicted nuclease of restriction endonuclease-like (RecB) superfamily